MNTSAEITTGHPQPATAAPVTERRKGTLLIVDDEEGPRISLKMIFKDDYELFLASDGPSSIDILKNNRIDVALLDIRMAGMSGIELLERLKYVDPAIEVVMMTAFETRDTIRQALKLRACDYINKPFDLSTVRSTVSAAMQRRTLDGEIRTNAEQLKQLMTELQNQRMEEKIAHTRGEIYASIIHDINGPLTVISGFVQLMTQRLGNSTQLDSADVEFLKDRLRTITRQVTNCIEISRRYLSFIRRQACSAPKVSVNQVLVDLNHLLHVHPSRQHHQFAIQSLPEDLAVKMNGTDLIQVLLNLAVNGFQCSPEAHSVTVEASGLQDAVDLSLLEQDTNERLLNVECFENRGPMLKVSIRDTGPGIPQEVLPKVFEPYFTTKAPKQGTGLGLSIVQRLIREAKGALHVRTQLGVGTTFTVYLPATNGEMSP